MSTGVAFVLLTYGGTFALGLWIGWRARVRYARDGFPQMLIPEIIMRFMDRVRQ